VSKENSVFRGTPKSTPDKLDSIITALTNLFTNSTPSYSKDTANRVASNTVFGEQIIGKKVPYIAAQFIYPLDSESIIDGSSGIGSISISDSLAIGETGASDNSSAVLQSKNTVRYIPGHESYIFFTAIFDTPVDGSGQEIGLYDGNNGFWVGYKDTQFGLMRLRNGVENFVHIEDFDTDILTGNNVHDFIFDPTKGNVFKISYGYLGFAVINLEILCNNGDWLTVHTIRYPNENTATNIGNTYLPVRAKVYNTTNNTNLTLKSGSVSAGIVDGGSSQEDVTSRKFSLTLLSIATGTNTELVVLRNKSVFGGVANHIPFRATRVSFATDGAQSVSIAINRNMTITNSPTWQDVDANSIIEYSTDAVVTPGTGREFISFQLAKNTDYVENVLDYEIILLPNETATVLVNGNNDVLSSITWKELF
jgi:hypothetical protein